MEKRLWTGYRDCLAYNVMGLVLYLRPKGYLLYRANNIDLELAKIDVKTIYIDPLVENTELY